MQGECFPHLLEVRLWIHEGQEEAFERFEALAIATMAEHGLRLINRTRSPHPQGPDTPFEIHQIGYNSDAELHAYQADPRMKAAAPLRAQAIADTQIIDPTQRDLSQN